VQDAPAAMRAEFAPVDSLHAWLEARKDALDFLSNRRCNT
jgi:hypothetical protein